MYTDFKDYYRALQIGYPATAEEIKAAYRKMAREYHPDMHPEETETYTRAFQEITEAYESLSDPLRKLDYDVRYRQVVLREVPAPYYVEDYFETAEMPADNMVYEHKYTKREGKSFPFVKIGMLLVLIFQVLRLILQAAPIAPERKAPAAVVQPENIQELLQKMREQQEPPKPENGPVR